MSKRPAPPRFDARTFALRLLAWLLPVIIVWLLITPFYNRFLTIGTERLVRLTERPAVTRLSPRGTHHFIINRPDVGREDGVVGSVRVTPTFHCSCSAPFSWPCRA